MLIRDSNEYAKGVYLNNERFIQIRLGNDLYWEAPKSYDAKCTLSYNTPLIPASGGTSTPILNCSSTWGYYEKTTGGGSGSSNYTVTYAFKDTAPSNWSIDAATGVITAASLETTERDETRVIVVGTVITSNKTITVECSVSQAENVLTLTGAGILSGTIADIPASGGTVSTFTTISMRGYGTFSSGSSFADYIDDVNSKVFSYSGGPFTGENLGTTTKNRTKLGSLTVTAIGTSRSKTIDVYQASNSAKYGDITCNFTTETLTLFPVAATDVVKIADNIQETITYSSGAIVNNTNFEYWLTAHWTSIDSTSYDKFITLGTATPSGVYISTIKRTDMIYMDGVMELQINANEGSIQRAAVSGTVNFTHWTDYFYSSTSSLTASSSSAQRVGWVTLWSRWQGWTATYPSWITISPTSVADRTMSKTTTSGENRNTVYINVSENTSYDSRSGDITFTGNLYGSNVVTVTQPGKTKPVSISVDEESVYLDNDSNDYYIVVTSTGQGWTASTNSSWISIETDSGTTGDTKLYFSTPYNTGSSRSGSIVISGNTSGSITVNVEQSGGFEKKIKVDYYTGSHTYNVSAVSGSYNLYVKLTTGEALSSSNNVTITGPTATWISLSTWYSGDRQVISVGCPRNTTGSSRSASFTLTKSGYTSMTVTFTQSG